MNSGDGDMRRILVPLATIFREESNSNSEAAIMKAQQNQRSMVLFQSIFTAVMILTMIIVLFISPFTMGTLLSCFVTILCLMYDYIKCYKYIAINHIDYGLIFQSEALPKHGKNFNDATRVQHITHISAESLTGCYTFIEKLVNSGDGEMRRITSYLYG